MQDVPCYLQGCMKQLYVDQYSDFILNDIYIILWKVNAFKWIDPHRNIELKANKLEYAKLEVLF